MKRLGCSLVLLLWVVSGWAAAQQPPRPHVAVAPAPKDVPAKSPVAMFRELLAMPRADRARFIATRPPEAQKIIRAKLREYETLRPEQRELRLKSTELRWYMLTLMSAPATNRNAQLQAVPAEDRELVAARLAEWDALRPEVQQELLQNEATLQYFSEVNSGVAENISPARRERLEASVAQWRALPEERRREIALRFNRFFDLSADEQARALQNLSSAERRQIQKTLKSFEGLPDAQRRQCVASFEKLASLSVEERQEFLKNAERWKLMDPEERQAWRELVSQLSIQPPLPHGANARFPRQTGPRAPLPIGAATNS